MLSITERDIMPPSKVTGIKIFINETDQFEIKAFIKNDTGILE